MRLINWERKGQSKAAEGSDDGEIHRTDGLLENDRWWGRYDQLKDWLNDVLDCRIDLKRIAKGGVSKATSYDVQTNRSAIGGGQEEGLRMIDTSGG